MLHHIITECWLYVGREYVCCTIQTKNISNNRKYGNAVQDFFQVAL
jgi:hypothetical protein